MTTHAPPTQLTRSDYRTLGLSALGGALEFYDFIIFIFFAKVLGDCSFRPAFRSGRGNCRHSASLRPAT